MNATAEMQWRFACFYKFSQFAESRFRLSITPFLDRERSYDD